MTALIENVKLLHMTGLNGIEEISHMTALIEIVKVLHVAALIGNLKLRLWDKLTIC